MRIELSLHLSGLVLLCAEMGGMRDAVPDHDDQLHGSFDAWPG
jgi:hypothetical protein